MDIKEIKQVIELMKKSELTEFKIEEEGLSLYLKRGGTAEAPVYPTPPAGTYPQPTAAAAAPASQPAPAPAEDKDAIIIRSPMVGTFYRAPSPESKPFAEEGTKVTEESIVCIIEAMKVMNEIQAEVKGTVKEILVENGETIEYGQPLFKLSK